MIKDDVKKCPRCRLINLPSAKYCDCGYTFITPVMDEHKSHIFDKMRRRKGFYMIIGGIGSLILGSILTFASYMVLEVLKWGIYVAFIGLILGGLASIWRGIKLIIGERT